MLIVERVRHVNRVKGLLFSQGISGYEPLRRDRRRRLATLQTGDDRLPVHLKAQVCRELDRLELLLEGLYGSCACTGWPAFSIWSSRNRMRPSRASGGCLMHANFWRVTSRGLRWNTRRRGLCEHVLDRTGARRCRDSPVRDRRARAHHWSSMPVMAASSGTKLGGRFSGAAGVSRLGYRDWRPCARDCQVSFGGGRLMRAKR